MSKISVIIPCYFNEKNISITGRALIQNEKLFSREVEFEYIFVDDGSKDNTYYELIEFQKKYPKKVQVIKLTRNFGANQASYCGMHYASGDCNVIFAADLQEPPELIYKMFKHWKRGYKYVVAQITKRNDGWITDFTSNIVHLIVKKFIFHDYPSGGINIFLFDKKLKDDLIKMEEKNLYLPQLCLWLGYDFVSVSYTRAKRSIGTSKWNFAKRVKAFIDIFVEFSFLPIRLISIMGLILTGMALYYSIAILIAKINGKVPITGWASLTIILLFVSSFIMISLGIIGEYIWRLLEASRNRPNYVIAQINKKQA